MKLTINPNIIDFLPVEIRQFVKQHEECDINYVTTEPGFEANVVSFSCVDMQEFLYLKDVTPSMMLDYLNTKSFSCSKKDYKKLRNLVEGNIIKRILTKFGKKKVKGLEDPVAKKILEQLNQEEKLLWQ